METAFFTIDNIPAALYGAPSPHVFLYVHGKCGYKEEAEPFAGIVRPKGWQVLSIDLPERGARKGERDTFDPWHVVPELAAVMAYARRNWESIALRATSLGAWFSLLAFAEEPLETCLFVSPVLDMAQLIQTMMDWAKVSEAELREREKIETAFGETLSWAYLHYAQAHAISSWPWPTAILYAGGDSLTPRKTVDAFLERFHWDLTVMENGEHWFHTPEQLAVLRQWEDAKTAQALTPEESLFFLGKEDAWRLYKAFRRQAIAELGAVHIKVQKTQITFSGKHGFAFVSLPRRKKETGIVISFGLFHRQASDRIEYASEPYPNRWTHHVRIEKLEELDEELMDWIKEAYWFSEEK